jgi:hypothetical protein
LRRLFAVAQVLNIFSGAISCCTLYLFPAKEAGKRMPLPSGLGQIATRYKSEIYNR